MTVDRRISGFLNVWKPAGVTSFHVVRQVRHVLGVEHVGHAGTLDPDASGILPVAVGEATRCLEWVTLTPKVYRTTMHLGSATLSGDAQGRIVGRSGPPWPPRSEVEAAALWLTGTVWQIPPSVSALKQSGRRLMERVRRGESVWPAPRLAAIERLSVLDGDQATWYLEVVVGKGVFVRTIVRDWAEHLGHAGSLSDLERVQVGRFLQRDAITVEQLAAGRQAWRTPAQVLEIPTVVVSREALSDIGHGRGVDLARAVVGPLPSSDVVGLLVDEELVAVVEGSAPWRYRKVLAGTVNQLLEERPD